MRRFGTLVAVAALLVLGAPAASAAEGWVTVGSDRARPLDESQGLATVVRPGGTTIRYTGIGTIPLDLRVKGWNHVGDPGSALGYYVEPYQRDDRGAKLFRVQAPDGKTTDYQHALESWEANNNSFAAVSPDGRWLVAGEWGTMDRLLVHPMPGVAFTDPGKNLPYASAIRLDHPVRDVQGCDFVTATRLLCSSDDPDGKLFGVTKPLLQVDLSAPVHGSDVTGKVRSLGQLPLESACGGDFEAEGIDYDERDGTLRVVVVSPGICAAIDSKTWRFRAA
ncbi:hypothetical protein [Amycolatopsis sp. CA-230715]|uniref:hypothetical protein n=1 Tax=Amycolatopsis sp. CA-230715 TaxID=2745196 RepID=UPI001C0357CA|nr:hypothetical protein [Amycolatopsis sp. CA-230715]QWF83574.1 hypothetical protein HUW46_07017 [Amycolatopsis sp. CA-230715]